MAWLLEIWPSSQGLKGACPALTLAVLDKRQRGEMIEASP
jgi:hypothetical protein